MTYRKALLLVFVAIITQGCGDEMFGGESEAEKKAKLQSEINNIETKRRNAPDFKCGIPEIPGHTLGANPKCK